MPEQKKHPFIILFYCARFFLGGVFLYASYGKILNPEGFSHAVFNYQILPDQLVNLTAIILPWVEIFIGFCLITGWWIPGAVVIVNTLLVIFISALVFNMARGLDVKCGCFSADFSENAATWITLLRDTFFLIVGFFLIYMLFFFKESKILRRLSYGKDSHKLKKGTN